VIIGILPLSVGLINGLASLIYGYIFFVLLPSVFITTRERVFLAYKIFMTLLVSHLVLGYVDFVMTSVGDDYLLPRHLAGIPVGNRFHGLAGEPRDAFIFGVTSLFVYLFMIRFLNIEKNKLLISLIVLSVLLTKSFSGMMALVIFPFLLLFFGGKYLHKSAFRNILFSLMFLLIASIILYSISTRRFDLYYNLYAPLLFSDYVVDGFDGVIQSQIVNVLPLVDLLRSIYDLDFIKILFGSGSSSSGRLVLDMGGITRYIQPNSFGVKLVYEFGVVGLVVFLLLAKRFMINSINIVSFDVYIYMSFVLMVSALLAHNSYYLYIAFGLIQAVKRIGSGVSSPKYS